MSGAADVWRVEVKFQGSSCSLVGKLPAEKRNFLKDLPKKLSVSSRTKYSAIPGTSFFCKFASKDAGELLEYLKRKHMALCVTFPYGKYLFTLHLVAPVDLHHLKSLQRLKRTGASVESLCRDDDGVIIGVLSKEINKEIEDKMLQKQASLQEAVIKAKTLSTSLGDPLLELDMLLERLPETKSAIEICMRFILQRQDGFEDIWRKILHATESFEHTKGKLNVIFLVHEVFRKVRGGTNEEHGNAKLLASPLVQASEKVLYKLLDLMDDDWKDVTVVQEILLLWRKWGVPFERPTMALDLPLDPWTDTTASSSPVSEQVPLTASAEVADLMLRHGITPGAWEVYLSRANADELYEIDHVLTLNENYGKFLPPNALENDSNNRRYWNDQFLHRYVKKNFKQLIDTHHMSVEPEQMRTSGEVMKEALLCTWEFDAEATKSIVLSDPSLIDELWRKLEARMPCDNLNAYVMSYLKRCNHTLYLQNPDFVKLAAALDKADDAVDIAEVKRLLGLVWTLSERAVTALEDLTKDRLLTAVKAATAAAKDGKPINVSRLLTFHFSQQIKTSSKGKWWSPRMRSTIHEAYKRKQTTHVLKESPPELTDAELAALKASIPKPPALKFTKVKAKDIQRTESNINGTMGMAISGIPNSGRGMFNLSKHPWPAFSVVCIFGSRRISEDMHHDGLNKVARCGEVGETFVVVNGEVKEVEKFLEQYGHRLVEYDGLVDAEGSMGGFPNDRVYEYPEDIYWDASGFYNNSILCPGCIVDPTKPESKIVLDQLYVVTWKEVPPMHEFFLAYGTSYYEEDGGDDAKKKKQIKR
ncbi:hypothetical protein ACHHYP_02791 [Achlya hypogyna]|uniref:CID domain-containing protein n=1 Tax=Achlya hypogyna TaxID=1202772 RepID=A0A1V9Z5H5_ACHHY|nr:hypothetical protein ACHHYP_02791 [Achlya hypogyna]